MNNETLPEQEFNLELPNIQDDGKIKPIIRIVDPSQALKDIGSGKMPDVVIGVTVDF